MYKVKPEHMPDIIECTDIAGHLTGKAAQELGLIEGIPVFGGGGDTTFVNIGAGCTKEILISMWEHRDGYQLFWIIKLLI